MTVFIHHEILSALGTENPTLLSLFRKVFLLLFSMVRGKVMLNLGENTMRIGPKVHRRTEEEYYCFPRSFVVIDGIVVAVSKILLMP